MTPPPAPPGATATDQEIGGLVADYGELLYRVAFAVVQDRQLAEDVVQEVLLKAWTSMPSWDGDVPVRWARTVARNTALSAVRHVSRRPTSAYDDIDPILLSHTDVERTIDRNESTSAMWSALSRLDDDSRLMLIMHEVDELTYEDIAELTETTIPAVKSKLFRARKNLRKDLGT